MYLIYWKLHLGNAAHWGGPQKWIHISVCASPVLLLNSLTSRLQEGFKIISPVYGPQLRSVWVCTVLRETVAQKGVAEVKVKTNLSALMSSQAPESLKCDKTDIQQEEGKILCSLKQIPVSLQPSSPTFSRPSISARLESRAGLQEVCRDGTNGDVREPHAPLLLHHPI